MSAIASTRSGEGEELAGQPRRAVGCVGAGLHVALAFRIVDLASLQDVGGAADHRQHIVEVVRDPAGQLPDRFHLLRLAKRLVRGFQFGSAFLDALLKRLVRALHDLIKTGIVDADRGLTGDPGHQVLMMRPETPRLAMPEEKAANDLTGPTRDRNG